ADRPLFDDDPVPAPAPVEERGVFGRPDEPELDGFLRSEPVQAPRAAPVEEVASAPAEEPEDVPFYRKALANSRDEDPNGYGPNWSNVDDFDIPTVLRKQMD
ncbi:MAG: hypothetical protein OES47_00770, partial [Acidobacteriota bacterium]|nr:hypothetical protein [Acidobacteriota bacterium]